MTQLKEGRKGEGREEGRGEGGREREGRKGEGREEGRGEGTRKEKRRGERSEKGVEERGKTRGGKKKTCNTVLSKLMKNKEEGNHLLQCGLFGECLFLKSLNLLCQFTDLLLLFLFQCLFQLHLLLTKLREGGGGDRGGEDWEKDNEEKKRKTRRGGRNRGILTWQVDC